MFKDHDPSLEWFCCRASFSAVLFPSAQVKSWHSVAQLESRRGTCWSQFAHLNSGFCADIGKELKGSIVKLFILKVLLLRNPQEHILSFIDYQSLLFFSRHKTQQGSGMSAAFPSLFLTPCSVNNVDTRKKRSPKITVLDFPLMCSTCRPGPDKRPLKMSSVRFSRLQRWPSALKLSSGGRFYGRGPVVLA